MSAQRAGRSAEQEQFAASLHDMLAAADVPGAARRWASGDHSGGLALWRKLAGAGVTALAVPEKWGGLGAGPLDTVVACEELGHHALPGPVAESVAVVPGLIAALADGTASPVLGDALPRLAAGDLIATLALPPWLPYAPDADVAGLVLLAESGTTEAHVLWLAEPGARHRSVDRTRSLSEASRREVLAHGPAVASAVAQAFQAGALASAAQLLGAGRALLAASVRHAGQRIQFGRPVGAFQAVKHHLADVAIGLEFARPLLDAAAIALAAGDRGAARDVSAAKVACTEAARRAARAALQVHGAIGYTEEHDLHLWLMKVRALAGTWGSQAEHRARIMAELTAPDAPPWN
jgi:alkylation response protein AidB-like acyl-CoA dehydrogenase